MKALFSKAKLGKLRNLLSLLLIMGCYVIYQSFLVVAYYDIGLFIAVTVVAVLYDKLIASKGFDFSFKGRSFKRSFSLSDYDLSDSCNQYDVELYLKEPLPAVYYISGMSLCKKENTTK